MRQYLQTQGKNHSSVNHHILLKCNNYFIYLHCINTWKCKCLWCDFTRIIEGKNCFDSKAMYHLFLCSFLNSKCIPKLMHECIHKFSIYKPNKIMHKIRMFVETHLSLCFASLTSIKTVKSWACQL